MFETNIQNNSTLISLSKAAELTGYHQDYLGQLCRLGRLPAKKVGRNWFTWKEALDTFRGQSASPLNLDAVTETISENSFQEEATQQPENFDTNTVSENEVREVTDVIKDLRIHERTNPELAHTITISRVEGMPVSITKVRTPIVHTNNVQSIATNMRIQALQREVDILREMLNRLMTEVTKHSEILQGNNFAESWHNQHSLKHQYVSNFDFNPAGASKLQFIEEPMKIPVIKEERPKLTIITWFVSAGALAVVAFMAVGVVSGTFFGKPEQTQTVYYHQTDTKIEDTLPINIQPQVAGDSIDQKTLPTADEVGQELNNMVQ